MQSFKEYVVNVKKKQSDFAKSKSMSLNDAAVILTRYLSPDNNSDMTNITGKLNDFICARANGNPENWEVKNSVKYLRNAFANVEDNEVNQDSDRRAIARWVSSNEGKYPTRDKAYKICFALNLSVEEAKYFMTSILELSPFNNRNVEDIIVRYCLTNHLGYDIYVRLKENFYEDVDLEGKNPAERAAVSVRRTETVLRTLEQNGMIFDEEEFLEKLEQRCKELFGAYRTRTKCYLEIKKKLTQLMLADMLTKAKRSHADYWWHDNEQNDEDDEEKKKAPKDVFSNPIRIATLAVDKLKDLEKKNGIGWEISKDLNGRTTVIAENVQIVKTIVKKMEEKREGKDLFDFLYGSNLPGFWDYLVYSIPNKDTSKMSADEAKSIPDVESFFFHFNAKNNKKTLASTLAEVDKCMKDYTHLQDKRNRDVPERSLFILLHFLYYCLNEQVNPSQTENPEESNRDDFKKMMNLKLDQSGYALLSEDSLLEQFLLSCLEFRDYCKKENITIVDDILDESNMPKTITVDNVTDELFRRTLYYFYLKRR